MSSTSWWTRLAYDPTRVARLIRRAKKRNRPWHWQFRHRGIQLLGVLALLYGDLIAITISRHPSLKVDYLAKVNSKVPAVSEAESAWPLYRELPAFGLPAGFAWDYAAEDARVLFGEGWKPATQPAEADRLHEENLAGVLLPHLARLKAMAMWLAADLAWAGEQGDGARVVVNYQSILGTARHNREQVFLM